MHIALIIPPIRDFYTTPHRLSSLGTQGLYSLLIENNVQVKLYDFCSSVKQSRVLPPELAYLQRVMVKNEVGPLSFFSNYYHFGMPYKSCINELKVDGIDICLVSCFAFCYADQALELCKSIKTKFPPMTIIAGGAGPSVHPHYYLNDGVIDYVITGQVERCIGELVQALNGQRSFSSVPGCIEKVSIVDATVNSMPPASPPIKFSWAKTWESKQSLGLTTMLSRGCPKSCRFCSNHLVHGFTYCALPLSSIKEGITAMQHSIADCHRKIMINFEDDNLLLEPEYLFSVMDLFKQVFPQASFCAENGLDYTLMTESIVHTLIEKGMSKFNVTLGSIDQKMCNAYDRGLDPDLYTSVLALLGKNNIPVVTYYICGFAGDTAERVVKTLVFLDGCATTTGISMFYAVPGIFGFEDRSVFDGRPSCLCCGSSAYPWNNSLTTEQLITAFRLSRLSNAKKELLSNPLYKKMVETVVREKALFTIVKNNGTRCGGPRLSIERVPNVDQDMVDLYFSLTQ